MKCFEIVELIRLGKLKLTEHSIGPASIANDLRDDLIRYRTILKGIARGELDGCSVRYVCERNRDGGFRGCITCEHWFCPSVTRYVWGAETKNCGICLSRSKIHGLAGQQEKLNLE